MIKMNAQIIMPQVFAYIDKTINAGAKRGVKDVADGFVYLARANLSSKIAKHGGKQSGKLAGAIMAKIGSDTPGMSRYDVIVDTNRAPYAYWIEQGRYATIGLPYSKKNTKDFTKSKFGGHWFMSDTLKLFLENDIARKTVAEYIFKSFKSGIKS